MLNVPFRSSVSLPSIDKYRKTNQLSRTIASSVTKLVVFINIADGKACIIKTSLVEC